MWMVYSGTPRLYSEKSHFLPWLPPKEAVMALLCSTEWKLAKDPKRAAAYESEIQKLRQAGYVTPLTSAESDLSSRSWFIPHHMVHHNNKDRIIFNCSFEYQDQSLNEHLLPGPTLGSSLLGVLFRLREYPVAFWREGHVSSSLSPWWRQTLPTISVAPCQDHWTNSSILVGSFTVWYYL